mmetsp:Transcript_52142/g.122001  ORF Transcript_52142/g.122001 Transcript_52142/m.122001 type:complete len:309 (+) Transcript_52142:72-998(+)
MASHCEASGEDKCCRSIARICVAWFSLASTLPARVESLWYTSAVATAALLPSLSTALPFVWFPSAACVAADTAASTTSSFEHRSPMCANSLVYASLSTASSSFKVWTILAMDERLASVSAVGTDCELVSFAASPLSSSCKPLIDALTSVCEWDTSSRRELKSALARATSASDFDACKLCTCSCNPCIRPSASATAACTLWTSASCSLTSASSLLMLTAASCHLALDATRSSLMVLNAVAAWTRCWACTPPAPALRMSILFARATSLSALVVGDVTLGSSSSSVAGAVASAFPESCVKSKIKAGFTSGS